MGELIHCCGTKNRMKGPLVFGRLEISSHVEEGAFLEGEAVVVIREVPFGGHRRLADSDPLEAMVRLDSGECSRKEFGFLKTYSASISATLERSGGKLTLEGLLASHIRQQCANDDFSGHPNIS